MRSGQQFFGVYFLQEDVPYMNKELKIPKKPNQITRDSMIIITKNACLQKPCLRVI